MKTFILTLLLAVALVPHRVYAQGSRKNSSTARPGSPAVVPAGELFLGTWQWLSGGDTFRFTLSRNPAWRDPAGRSLNIIVGQHRYTRNGTVIEQYVAPGRVNYPFSLFGMPAENSMRLSYHESSTDIWGIVTLTLVPGNPNQLIWQLKYQEGLLLYTGARPADYFVTPLTMTLTRVP